MEDGTIIEGHGRLKGYFKILNMENSSRSNSGLDHMSEEEKKALYFSS